ncbi:MAG: hypothetical protein AB2598_10810 [Candidatus Thiodiazotropha sp.]
MQDNSFSNRWRLDDKAWVRARHRAWKDALAHLRLDGNVPKRQHKYLRAYFLTGDPVPLSEPMKDGLDYPLYFPPQYRLFYTPSASLEEALDVVQSIPPSELHSVYELAKAVGFGSNYVGHDRGACGGQERYVIRALFPEVFYPLQALDHGRAYNLYDEPENFIATFEAANFRFLTKAVTTNRYHPMRYLIEHWLSCVRYLEANGNATGGASEYRAPLLSAARHFVEPRYYHEVDSPTHRFAKKLCQRFEKDDIPASLRQAWQDLSPQGILLEKRADGGRYGFEGNKMSRLSLRERVVLGVDFNACLSSFVAIAEEAGFLDDYSDLVDGKEVDLGEVLTDEFKEVMGYDRQVQHVPAKHVGIRLNDRFSGAASLGGRCWIDFYQLYPGEHYKALEEMPTLLYMPRLSKTFSDWCIPVCLFLNERYILEEVHQRVGQYFYIYAYYPRERLNDRRREELFMRKPYINKNVHIFNDYKGGILNLCIGGLTVTAWEGVLM